MGSRTLRLSIPLVAAGAALWGTDPLFRFPLTQHFSALAIVLGEHLVLVPFALLLVLPSLGSLRRMDPWDWVCLVAVAWGASALATVLFTQAFATASPTTAILLQKLQPLFALAGARIVLGERLPARFSLYAAICLGGSYLVSFGLRPPGSLTAASVAGPLSAIAAAALWGLGTVFGRRLLAKLSFREMTGWRFLAALPFLFVLNLFGHTLGQTGSLPGSALTVVALALVPGLVSLLLYYRGLVGVPASVATFLELAYPATGVLVGYLALHQALTVGQAVGFGLIWLMVAGFGREAPVPASARLRAAVPAAAGAAPQEAGV